MTLFLIGKDEISEEASIGVETEFFEELEIELKFFWKLGPNLVNTVQKLNYYWTMLVLLLLMEHETMS